MFNPDNDYITQLSQILGSEQGQQPMLAPAVMPVNVRAPQPFNPGAAGPSEEQVKDAEKAQLISTIGSAVGGVIGAYGQANQTGAYAPGGALGGQPAQTGAAAPAATPAAPATAAATQTPVTYGGPPIDNFGSPGSARPSYMLQDPAIHDENAYTGLSQRGRDVQNSTPDWLTANPYRPSSAAEQGGSAKSSYSLWGMSDPPRKLATFQDGNQPFTSPTQPTGESTVRHPQLDALYRQYYGQVGISGHRPRELGY